VSLVSVVRPEREAGLAGVPAGCCDGAVGGAGLVGVSTGLCGEGVGLARDGSACFVMQPDLLRRDCDVPGRYV
jgi:hypothetical protein